MSRFSPLISVDEALRRILAVVPRPRAVSLPISECAGLTLASAVRARVDLPSFDNSSVDGYAVRSSDVREASPRNPVLLKVMETIWAGRWPKKAVRSGGCSRIATGAPFPKGADAVVMQEDTKAGPGSDRIFILREVVRGENVRPQGLDVRRNRLLLSPSKTLRPMDLMLAAQAGHARLDVTPKPRVTILSTGSELTPPGRPLPRGKIFDGNSEGLAALTEWAGGRVVGRERVGDDLRLTRTVLRRCLKRSDVVITCAGISVGGRDWLRRALFSLGARERFWRVSMKPGRPLALFTLGRKIVLCLPGNPVSAFVTFLLFVKPVLEKLLGRETSSPFANNAHLAHSVTRTNRRQFLRGRLRTERKGTSVGSAGGQDSHMLSSLVNADCLFEVPEGQGQLPAGAVVRVFPFSFV